MSDRKAVRNRRGVSIIYVTVIMTCMLMFCSLGVDVARVQVAKTELRRAVDGAARFGAMGLDRDTTTAINNASISAADNMVDGQTMNLVPSQDVIIGSWDTTKRTFTVLTGNAAANGNAVQVIGRKIAARNTAIPLTFAAVMGMKTCDIKAVSAIAMVTKSVNVNQNVPGTANPFLAGMPRGSVASLDNPHNSPDFAGDTTNPRQSPLQVGMALDPSGNQSLTFDSISGDVRHDPNLAYFSPDGELDAIGDNTNGSENGISDLVAPINALVGVFLDDNAPNTSSAPQTLDFSTQASRDFSSLRPKMKQLFFIGDGLKSDGTVQQFVVPQGATRLYLATWDFYEWNNNAGARNIKVNRPASVTLVK